MATTQLILEQEDLLLQLVLTVDELLMDLVQLNKGSL